MAKKKNSVQVQMQKQATAEHRKQFMIRIKKFMIEINLESHYHLISKSMFEDMYNFRILSAKIVAAESDIPPHIIKDGQFLLRRSMQDIKIPLIDFDTEISLGDYYELWLTLTTYFSLIEKESEPNLPTLKAFFEPYFEITDETCFYYKMFNSAHLALHPTLLGYNFLNSSFNTSYFWSMEELILQENRIQRLQLIITLHGKEVPQKQFVIDNNARPAYRVGCGIANKALEWVQIAPSIWGEEGPFSSIPLDIYIQAHAIQRLKDRLDGIPEGLVHSNIFGSLRDPKIMQLPNGKLFIECRLFEKKAGYLVASVVEGVILIRTFLFLTNNGTPEGEKLAKLTGLKKLDKSYLAIDKLSAFFASDIRDNEKVMNIIRKADCESLLELCEFVFEISKIGSQQTGKLMEAYLQLFTEHPIDEI